MKGRKADNMKDRVQRRREEGGEEKAEKEKEREREGREFWPESLEGRDR